MRLKTALLWNLLISRASDRASDRAFSLEAQFGAHFSNVVV